MDILDDILDAMDKNKRPRMSSADKVIMKQNEALKKTAQKERTIINNFKVKIQKDLSEFLKNVEKQTIQFESMEKVFRTIINEVVEELNSGLIAHTFGREERYIVVYKDVPSGNIRIFS